MCVPRRPAALRCLPLTHVWLPGGQINIWKIKKLIKSLEAARGCATRPGIFFLWPPCHHRTGAARVYRAWNMCAWLLAETARR